MSDLKEGERLSIGFGMIAFFSILILCCLFYLDLRDFMNVKLAKFISTPSSDSQALQHQFDNTVLSFRILQVGFAYVCGLVCILFGLVLFLFGVTGRFKTAATIESKGSFLLTGAPGLFFALCGTLILALAVTRTVFISSQSIEVPRKQVIGSLSPKNIPNEEGKKEASRLNEMESKENINKFFSGEAVARDLKMGEKE